MSQILLENLGLSPNEAKIYLCLLKNGERGVSDISTHSGVHRRNVYDALDRLLAKGLVQQSLDTKESKYAPVDPHKLQEIVDKQARELNEALPQLVKEFEYTRPEQSSYIVKGQEGMKLLWKQMVKEKADIYGFGVKAQWFDPELESDRKIFFSNLEKIGVTIYLLADYNLVKQDKDFIPNYPYKKRKHRILPKEYDTTSLVNIFGDYTVFYNQVIYRKISPDTTFYVIKDRDLAESHRRWFHFMWTLSKEIKNKSA